MPHLNGYTIEYRYDGADAYRVVFSEGHATWLVLTGDNAGETRKERAFGREVAPGVQFITWLEPTGEVVTLAANFDAQEITCSYTNENEQHMWQGTITRIDRPAAS